jgi:hypothetical protein
MAASEGSVREAGKRGVTIAFCGAAVAVIGLMVYFAAPSSSVPVRNFFSAPPAVIDPTIQPAAPAPPLASCHSLFGGTDSYPVDAAPPDDGTDNARGVCTAHRQHLMIIELWLCAALLLMLYGTYRSLATPVAPSSGPDPAISGVG